MKYQSSASYDKKVGFYKTTNSNDDYDDEYDGYNDDEPEFDFHKWVKVETLATKETEISGQLMGEATHKITCRYSNKITATHVIKYKSATYEIIGQPTNVDFANVSTEIIVKELTDA